MAGSSILKMLLFTNALVFPGSKEGDPMISYLWRLLQAAESVWALLEGDMAIHHVSCCRCFEIAELRH